MYRGERDANSIQEWVHKKINGSILPFEYSEKDFVLI
jgi:hypothetical protein